MNDEEPLKDEFHELATYVDPTPDFAARVMTDVRRDAECHQVRPVGRLQMLGFPLPRYATAFGIAIALVIAFLLWPKPGVGTAIAFADVKAAIRQIDTAVIVCRNHERPFWDYKVYYRRGSDLTVVVWQNGVVHINDPHGKTLILNTKKKLARYSGGAPSGMSSDQYLDRLANIEDHAVGRLGKRTIDGQTLVGFVLKPQGVLETIGKARTEIWVDPQTRLPVREEYRPTDPDDLVAGKWRTTRSYTFDVPVDDSLFTRTPPKGYTVLEGAGLHPLLATPCAEPPSDPKLAAPTANLLAGIGPARFGMSLQEILEVLGQPDGMNYFLKFSPDDLERSNEEFDRIYKEVARRVREEHLDTLEEQTLRSRLLKEMHDKYIPVDVGDTFSVDYAARGIDLVVDSTNGLIRVFCLSKESSLYGGFRGATTEGIAIGSSVEEVEKAYGPADLKSIDDEGSGGLVYVSLAAQFQIEEGRVCSFSFDRDAETGGYDQIKLNNEE